MHLGAYLVAALICLLSEADALAAELTPVNVNLTPEAAEIEHVKQGIDRVLTLISPHAQGPQQGPALTQRPKARSVEARSVEARSKVRLEAGFDRRNFLKERSFGEQMNANTIAVISGRAGSNYLRMASDLAYALDDGDNLRILPVLGKSAGQNAYDVRFLRGIDIGFVRTDALEQLRQDNRLKEINRRIAYITRLGSDELHIVVPNKTTSITELDGKKVSFDVAGSDTDYSGRLMFMGLGINVDAVNVDQSTAFSMLKKGELAAVVSVAAKPVAVVASFQEDGFHILPVPRIDNIADRYMPATVSHEDYPRLVKEGETVDTISVGTILGVYDWPTNTERYTRVSRFVDAFFTHFDRLLETERDPKWKEVDLYAEVPGWHRFPAAEAWAIRHAAEVLRSLLSH